MSQCFPRLLAILILASVASAQAVLLSDINPGVLGSEPTGLTAIGSSVFFFADDGVNGSEPWVSDGTPSGTLMLADLNPGTPGSLPPATSCDCLFHGLGGFVYFAADDGTSGIELWKTDGTPGGTTLVKDINPGAGSSAPSWFAELFGQLYFAANDGLNGNELWVSDGTGAGTVLFKDIYPGAALFLPPFSSNPMFLTPMAGGRMVFAATDGGSGTELWVSDGTASGTTLLADLHPGVGPPFGQANNSFPRQFTQAGGLTYFTATTGGQGEELWLTDSFAVLMAADINPAVGLGSAPMNLTESGGALYLSADDGTNGRELWRASGVSASLVADLEPGATGSAPDHLVDFGGTIRFAANIGGNAQVWSSDGTLGGTSPVTSIQTNALGMAPTGFINVGPDVYFRSSNDLLGGETTLWRLTGGAGPAIPAPSVGVPGASPRVQTEPGVVTTSGRFVFLREDAINGLEVWSLDATAPVPGAAGPYGAGCGALAMPTIFATPPVLGTTATITGAGLSPGLGGAVYADVGIPGPTALGPCTIYINLAAPAPIVPFTTSATGTFSVGSPIPPAPSLSGLVLTLQAGVLGTATPIGADVTSALRVVLGS